MEQATLERPSRADSITPRDALQELARRKARDNFLAWFKLTNTIHPYYYGPHTLGMIDMFQKCVDRLKRGISSYFIINCPPRHGKSDVSSRSFPPWFVTTLPNAELILTSYNFELASEMSFDARRRFQEWGPLYGLSLEAGKSGIESWRLSHPLRGRVSIAGLNGTVTGRGAHFLVVDDYLKGIEEAESKRMRDKVWDTFRHDLLTRLAPVHAIAIVANRWHVDDLVGRIISANDPEKDTYRPDLPAFEVLKFPAYDEATERYLFTERFPESWYKLQRSGLAEYGWAAQGQQEPIVRHGNLLKTNQIVITHELPKDIIWSRGWDIASTTKQRASHDPDFTVGTRAGIKDNTLYIDDVRRGRWGATERDEIIEKTALEDGRSVHVNIEGVAGYIDTWERLRFKLSGHSVVKLVKPTLDKVARASLLEPFFDEGRVVLRLAGWNNDWIEEISRFPKGTHDDQVDSLVMTIYDKLTRSKGMRVYA